MPADDRGAAPFVKVYASIADAKAGIAAECAKRGPARRIRCAAAGTLPVRVASGEGLEPLPFVAGETQDVQAVAIDDAAPATGCASITVFW